MNKVLFCSILLFFSMKLAAQNYQLHAVYMYQFTKYIKWPETQEQGDFVIGVLGDTPAIEHLEKMAEVKKAGKRDIIIKKFKEISDIEPMHMLFVGKNAVSELAPILKEVEGTHTLLVTEKEGFGLEGSNINFVVREGRLVFEMNQHAMDRETLKVSSELAKLAIVL